MRGKVFLFVSIILHSSLQLLGALSPSDSLVTVIVQFEINEEIISSRDAYTEAMEEAMKNAMDEGPADLVIFPEYIGVFAALIPWHSYLKSDEPFEEVWTTIRKDHRDIASINELFLRESKQCDAFLNELWGRLAAEYEVCILSGTRLNYSSSRGGLVNQAVVYDSRGNVKYRQNKYFLTELKKKFWD